MSRARVLTALRAVVKELREMNSMLRYIERDLRN